MTNKEAIKYLQQLYPNGGHCWLDEQRIEAIGMAVKALQEEPVSKELEQAAVEAFKEIVDDGRNSFLEIFKAGAKWQKENLWKSADGNDLPEYEREVIALTQPYPLEGSEFAVSFAHRPDPKGWDGKSLTTGKVEHYTPKTYDNGWNIPDVRFWLDCLLPNLKED